MSEIIEIADKIKKLKNIFLNVYDTNKKKANEIIGEIRLLHARALLINNALLSKYINIKNYDDIPNEIAICISANTSFLHLIECHLRRCERINLGYENKPGQCSPHNSDYLKRSRGNLVAILDHLARGDSNGQNYYMGNIKFEGGADSTYDNNIEAPLTEENVSVSANLTDFINNLNTEDINNLDSEIEIIKPKSGSINHENRPKQHILFDIKNPTIINFWANWCGPSNNFLPHWNQFKSNSNKILPEFQILDLDVGNDKDLQKIARDAGVKSYPTIVIYYKGRTYYHPAGSLTSNKIVQLVHEIINENNI